MVTLDTRCALKKFGSVDDIFRATEIFLSAAVT